jgi:hypothetical protein
MVRIESIWCEDQTAFNNDCKNFWCLVYVNKEVLAFGNGNRFTVLRRNVVAPSLRLRPK